MPSCINLPTVHALYEKLLLRFCEDLGLDPRLIKEMAEGDRAVPQEIMDLMAKRLDVPAKAWRQRRQDGLVPRPVSRHTGRVNDTDTRPTAASEPKRRRRRYSTPVHDVLDRIGWTIGDLAEAVSKELDKPISRASMQFWATGQRKVKKSKKDKSTEHAVQAPRDVREAAYEVTKRNAHDKKLGPEAILNPSSWPNVETQ